MSLQISYLEYKNNKGTNTTRVLCEGTLFIYEKKKISEYMRARKQHEVLALESKWPTPLEFIRFSYREATRNITTPSRWKKWFTAARIHCSSSPLHPLPPARTHPSPPHFVKSSPEVLRVKCYGHKAMTQACRVEPRTLHLESHTGCKALTSSHMEHIK